MGRGTQWLEQNQASVVPSYRSHMAGPQPLSRAHTSDAPPLPSCARPYSRTQRQKGRPVQQQSRGPMEPATLAPACHAARFGAVQFTAAYHTTRAPWDKGVPLGHKEPMVVTIQNRSGLRVAVQVVTSGDGTAPEAPPRLKGPQRS